MNVVEGGCRYALVLAAALVWVGCGAPTNEEPLPEGALADDLGELEHEVRALTFQTFEDAKGVGNRGQTQTRVILTSAQSYQSYFGHAAPAAVNFAQGDAVIFYSAGVKNTGGYSAHVVALSRSNSGKTVYVTTQLVSPGKDCFVTQAFTKPYVLAKFKLPKQAKYVGWLKDDSTIDCTEPEPEPYNPCAATLCPVGTVCEVKQIQCITTPCDPIAECVPQPSAPFCGGFAGIDCPGAGSCVDNPADDCNPKTGGADCGGLCECNALGSCIEGYKWNGSPSVCGCEKVTSTPPTGAQCGDKTCAAGTVCCNASCGMCVPPGMACIQIACN